jgi:hypothetical protein
MPNIDASTLKYNIRNANDVRVTLGTATIGFGQTLTDSVAFGTDSFYGIGTAKPQEIQQLKVSPSITLDFLSLTKQGRQLLNNPTDWLTVLNNNSFDMHLLDASGATFRTYVGAVADNYSHSVPTNQAITESITFQAIDVLDANGVSVFNSLNNAIQTIIG